MQRYEVMHIFRKRQVREARDEDASSEIVPKKLLNPLSIWAFHVMLLFSIVYYMHERAIEGFVMSDQVYQLSSAQVSNMAANQYPLTCSSRQRSIALVRLHASSSLPVSG